MDSTRARARRRRRAASGSRAGSSSRATIICTAALSARPSPVTASFTSFGLYERDGDAEPGAPRRARGRSPAPPTSRCGRSTGTAPAPRRPPTGRVCAISSRSSSSSARRRSRQRARRAACGSRRSRAPRLAPLARRRSRSRSARAPGRCPAPDRRDRTRARSNTGSMLEGRRRGRGDHERAPKQRARARTGRARRSRPARGAGPPTRPPRRGGRSARPPATRSGAARCRRRPVRGRSAPRSPPATSPAPRRSALAPGRRSATVRRRRRPTSTSRSRFSTNWREQLRRHVGEHAAAELRDLARDRRDRSRPRRACPSPSSVIVTTIVAFALPCPRVSRPAASITIRCAASSTSASVAVPLYCAVIGPTFTFTTPRYSSPSISWSCAPGRHGAIPSMSSNTFQVSSIGVLTRKLSAISITSPVGGSRATREVFGRVDVGRLARAVARYLDRAVAPQEHRARLRRRSSASASFQCSRPMSTGLPASPA